MNMAMAIITNLDEWQSEENYREHSDHSNGEEMQN